MLIVARCSAVLWQGCASALTFYLLFWLQWGLEYEVMYSAAVVFGGPFALLTVVNLVVKCWWMRLRFCDCMWPGLHLALHGMVIWACVYRYAVWCPASAERAARCGRAACLKVVLTSRTPKAFTLHTTETTSVEAQQHRLSRSS